MKIPKRSISLVDLLDDIEDSGLKIVALTVDHDGKSVFYDSEDVEFVDPELFELAVQSYEVKEYKKRKVGLTVVLKGE